MILTGHAGIEKDEAEVFISGAQQLTVESKQLKGKQLSTLHSALSTLYGGLAQLARASALHAEGQRFESVILHSIGNVRNEDERSMTYCTSKQ